MKGKTKREKMTGNLKKKIGIGLLVVLGIMLLAACGKEKKSVSGDGIYYMNSEETTIEKEPYQIKEKDAEKAARAMLKALSKAPEDVEMKPVISKRVKVLGFEVQEGKITVNFGGGYYEMGAVREVLCRAAIVQSLVQIDGIESVAFEVEGNPLTDKEGQVVGSMRAEDFIKNTGSVLHSYEKTNLTLYFGNEEGTALVPEVLEEVRYNTNLSTEKLAMERLLKGPTSGKLQSVLDSKVRLIGTSVKDGICYVNFDDTFLQQESRMDPALQIEALVRSLMENGKEIRAVQILVNGKSDQSYKGISLEQPFDGEAVRKKEEQK